MIGDLALVAGLHMDAAGAAIATVSAQALSVVFAVVLLIKKELPFSIARKDFRLNPQCKKSENRITTGPSGVSDTGFISGIMCVCQSSGTGSIFRLRSCM